MNIEMVNIMHNIIITYFLENFIRVETATRLTTSWTLLSNGGESNIAECASSSQQYEALNQELEEFLNLW